MKVLLISMKVLLISMKVLLISSNTERLNMPTMPLGLALVAVATRAAGQQVRFLDLLPESDPLQTVGRAVFEHGPEVIAPILLLEQARPIIEQCRACSDAPVVLEGTFCALGFFAEVLFSNLRCGPDWPRSAGSPTGVARSRVARSRPPIVPSRRKEYVDALF